MDEAQAIQNGFLKGVGHQVAQDYDAGQLAKLIQESGCAERTLHTASHYVAKAKECLETFPESPAKDALLSLSDFVIDRSW